MIESGISSQMAFCGNPISFKPRKLMEMKFELGKS